MQVFYFAKIPNAEDLVDEDDDVGDTPDRNRTPEAIIISSEPTSGAKKNGGSSPSKTPHVAIPMPYDNSSTGPSIPLPPASPSEKSELIKNQENSNHTGYASFNSH